MASEVIFKLTCGACPEQYDAVSPEGEALGYLRLRHGHFSVAHYGPGGPTALDRTFPLEVGKVEDLEPQEEALPYHTSDGIFTDSEVRNFYLAAAARRLTFDEDASYTVEGDADSWAF